MKRSKRIETLDARPVNLDGYINEWPEMGFVAMSSPYDPKPSVRVEDGKIVDVVAGDVEFEGAEVIDAGGKYISPGFIDTHCPGGGGYDFLDGTPEAIVGAAEMHAKHGTTLIYPTTCSCSDEALFGLFENYRKAEKMNDKGAAFGGIHIEGGYINKNMAGGQDQRYIMNPERSSKRVVTSSPDGASHLNFREFRSWLQS